MLSLISVVSPDGAIDFDPPAESLDGARGLWFLEQLLAAVSIGLSLLVVALLFPEFKGRSLLGSRGLPVVAACFAVDIGLQFVNNDPGGIFAFLPALLFLTALGLALVLLAWKLPTGGFVSMMRSPRPSASPRTFFFVAAGRLFSLLFVYLLGSHLVVYWESLGAFYVLGSALVLYLLLTRAGWREHRLHQIAFAAGMGAAFLLWDVVFGTLIGDVLAVPFAIFFLMLLIYLWSRKERLAAARVILGHSDHPEKSGSIPAYGEPPGPDARVLT